ncbi:hypothetical protein [Oleisolibacter albus]|uniref:hypothetical protein n=1 Tax=Oleisolibacter albus TaxID=2171757 RepID=UPI000DF13246|nr:hypothetical protein [Oleisolibacter albus]
MSFRNHVAASRLQHAVDAELTLPVPAAATALAAALADHGGGSVAAVLFYGSVLRTGDLDGILDFYVLTSSLRGWHRHGGLALATRLLPPTVEYWELPWQGGTVRAKVAVLRTDQFARAVRAGAIDTTIWARFCQPVRLLYARDQESRQRVTALIAAAVTTAAGWAARLGPPEGTDAPGFWDALFRHTYAAELRVEKGDRAVSIVDHARDRYAALLTPAWTAGGLAWEQGADGPLVPRLTPAARARARRAWAVRRRLGKLLNMARLVKAAFTFTGGVDYILWKIERHSGVRPEMTPWQRRHPVLSAPLMLWRLWRRGAVR